MPGLRMLLPEAAAVAQWRPSQSAGDATEAALYPGEEAAVSRSVPTRRQEFIVARSCARQALRQLGLPPVEIPKAPSGEPQWPSAVVGSITHCAGYAAAVVAPRTLVLALGIDAEPNDPLPGGVLDLIASATEIDRLNRLAAAHPSVEWGRLSFCAKEALYKAWFPMHHSWLGFEDVDLRLEPDGRFRGRLLASAPAHDNRFDDVGGRWALDHGVLLTAVALTAAESPR